MTSVESMQASLGGLSFVQLVSVGKPIRARCMASPLCSTGHFGGDSQHGPVHPLLSASCGAALGLALILGTSGWPGAGVMALPVPKLPPINLKDVNRCNPVSSAMGQANAARDKLLDLRLCDLHKRDLSGYDISGALMEEANLEGANLTDAQMSKAYAPKTNFRGAVFTNAVVDRVTFDGADLTGAIFTNAVLSDSSFEDANLENVDFTDAYVGDFLQKSLCKNPTLQGENPVTGEPTRESLGCRR